MTKTEIPIKIIVIVSPVIGLPEPVSHVTGPTADRPLPGVGLVLVQALVPETGPGVLGVPAGRLGAAKQVESPVMAWTYRGQRGVDLTN